MGLVIHRQCPQPSHPTTLAAIIQLEGLPPRGQINRLSQTNIVRCTRIMPAQHQAIVMHSHDITHFSLGGRPTSQPTSVPFICRRSMHMLHLRTQVQTKASKLSSDARHHSIHLNLPGGRALHQARVCVPHAPCCTSSSCCCYGCHCQANTGPSRPEEAHKQRCCGIKTPSAILR